MVGGGVAGLQAALTLARARLRVVLVDDDQARRGGRTTVLGVYAVGTTAVPSLSAIGAAGHASTTAVALHADLLERDLTS